MAKKAKKATSRTGKTRKKVRVADLSAAKSVKGGASTWTLPTETSRFNK